MTATVHAASPSRPACSPVFPRPGIERNRGTRCRRGGGTPRRGGAFAMRRSGVRLPSAPPDGNPVPPADTAGGTGFRRCPSALLCSRASPAPRRSEAARSPDDPRCATTCSSWRSTRVRAKPELSPGDPPWPATNSPPCAAGRGSVDPVPGGPSGRTLHRRRVQRCPVLVVRSRSSGRFPSAHVCTSGRTRSATGTRRVLPNLVALRSTPSGAARLTISTGIGTRTKSRTRAYRSSDHRSPVQAAISRVSARPGS